jgi:hypothetical protein
MTNHSKENFYIKKPSGNKDFIEYFSCGLGFKNFTTALRIVNT